MLKEVFAGTGIQVTTFDLSYLGAAITIIIIITRTASHTTKCIHQRDSPLVRLLGGEGMNPKSTQFVTVVTETTVAS